MNTLYMIISFLLGAYSIILVQKWHISSLSKKNKKYFSEILDNTALIKFSKRINNYAYFEFKNWEVIFIIDKQEIQIFDQDECLVTSSSFKNDKTISDLVNHIKTFWSVDMNNVVRINDTIISKNFVEEQIMEQRKMISSLFNLPFNIINEEEKEEQVQFTVDDILDKINLVGYNGLTKEEQEFLKNASK